MFSSRRTENRRSCLPLQNALMSWRDRPVMPRAGWTRLSFTTRARHAEALVRAAGHTARVRTGDFFAVTPAPPYDAVIGNPPYVRYQDFSGVARARAREAALRGGVTLTALASSWAGLRCTQRCS
jgi:hypothetical protein